MKLSWCCGQKDSWLATLANSGRVGVYLRVLHGGRVRPGDEVTYEKICENNLDIASITRLSFDNSLKTRDTLNLPINNDDVLMRLNRWHFLDRTYLRTNRFREIDTFSVLRDEIKLRDQQIRSESFSTSGAATATALGEIP
ncbi:hypothetical protein GGS20DRAFT_583550 [Poronia punctata]|nr:hypothetical protein GGS20DRAFT_583550 [Poronia punctata]